MGLPEEEGLGGLPFIHLPFWWVDSGPHLAQADTQSSKWKRKDSLPTALLSNAETAAGITKEGNGRQRDLEKKIQPADSSTLRFVQMVEYLEVIVPLAEHSEILTQ